MSTQAQRQLETVGELQFSTSKKERQIYLPPAACAPIKHQLFCRIPHLAFLVRTLLANITGLKRNMISHLFLLFRHQDLLDLKLLGLRLEFKMTILQSLVNKVNAQANKCNEVTSERKPNPPSPLHPAAT